MNEKTVPIQLSVTQLIAFQIQLLVKLFHKNIIAAKANIESLGMNELLKEHEQSSDLPVPDTDTLSDCDADVNSDLYTL